MSCFCCVFHYAFITFFLHISIKSSFNLHAEAEYLPVYHVSFQSVGFSKIRVNEQVLDQCLVSLAGLSLIVQVLFQLEYNARIWNDG